MMKTNKQDIINEVIYKLAPLNNFYRDSIKKGTQAYVILESMWVIGNILEEYIIKYKFKPHSFFWDIYGKSDGVKKSYITRDFLSYCFRIKKFFNKKEDIKNKFYYLKKYSLFRESLPFLENGKFGLNQIEKEELITILNSNNSFKDIKNYILNQKKLRINIFNPRNQRLDEVSSVKLNLDRFNLYIDTLFELSDEKIRDFIETVGSGNIQDVSKLCISFTSENLYVPKVKISDFSDEHFVTLLNELVPYTSKKIEDRNRLRKVVGVKKFFELAEKLAILSNPDKIQLYKKN